VSNYEGEPGAHSRFVKQADARYLARLAGEAVPDRAAPSGPVTDALYLAVEEMTERTSYGIDPALAFEDALARARKILAMLPSRAAAPCPHVRQDAEGSAYCTLAERAAPSGEPSAAAVFAHAIVREYVGDWRRDDAVRMARLVMANGLCLDDELDRYAIAVARAVFADVLARWNDGSLDASMLQDWIEAETAALGAALRGAVSPSPGTRAASEGEA
jgi:hypothetical protein